MSDEMSNNGNGEETWALFVSSQKKKQAEEEARKKAEAEQAKRDAAEAEVRRMEAEVEERKKKAEEEKRALEEAASQAEAEKANVAEKLKSSVNVDEIKSKVKEKTDGNPKLPIIIGACAAAAVVVILILVIVLKGKKTTVDYAALEFGTEYTTEAENNKVTFSYPESLYAGFTKADEADGVLTLVADAAKKSKAPAMTVLVSEPMVEKATIAITPAKEVQKALTDIAAAAVTANGVKVTEEESSDVASDTPGKYYYKCAGTTADGKAYALSAWLTPNSNGDYACIVDTFTDSSSDPANIMKLRDAFDEKNSTGALKVPGATPPAAVETDGMLEIDEIHMGILVPKDRFKKVEIGDGVTAWSDENGALYLVAHVGVDYDFQTAAEYLEEIKPGMKELSESAVGLKELPGFDSRMLLSEDDPADDLKYRAEYKDIYGGVTYWEGDYVSMWRDVRTNEYCFYSIILMAPNNNKDIYKQMFEKGIDRLQDI